MDVLIWDEPGQPPPKWAPGWRVVHWLGYAGEDSGNDVHVLSLVESKPVNLRGRFLRWIHNLGELNIGGKRLVDCLEVRSGFSAWWMSLLAEKCNYTKSRQINDVIKMLAFDDWAKGKNIKRVTLVTHRQNLSDCMRSWCKRSSIRYKRKTAGLRPSSRTWLKKIHDSLPHVFQGISWLLRHSWRIRGLRGAGVQEWRRSHPQATFVSYLFNLESASVTGDRFESRYWTLLPKSLRRAGIATNWLHLFVQGGPFASSKGASRWIQKLNQKNNRETHVILEAFLSWSVLRKTLTDYFRLVRNSCFLGIGNNLKNKKGINLWPFFRTDWEKSTRGCVAMSNCLYLNLFETAFQGLARETAGVYLQENQGWEFACIQAWRSAGLGHLLGHPHSTVRFWDLRYFFDYKSIQIQKNPMPKPDFVAVNGPAARKNYLEAGYPKDEIIEVEALRYLYLKQTKSPKTINEKQNTLQQKKDTSDPALLVVCDYDHDRTERQMRILEKINSELPKDLKIVCKPHPACPILENEYPLLKFSINHAKIEYLVKKIKWAFCSSTTSAGLDCFLAGLQVIVMLDDESLNFSPLRGWKRVCFAANSQEALSAIKNLYNLKETTPRHKVYFNFDSELTKWKHILTRKRK